MNSRVISNFSLAAGMLLATACSSGTGTTQIPNANGGAGATIGTTTTPSASGGNTNSSSSQANVGGSSQQTSAGGTSSSSSQTNAGGTSSSSSSSSAGGTKAAGGSSTSTSAGGTSSSSSTNKGGTTASGGTSSSSSSGQTGGTSSSAGGSSSTSTSTSTDPLGGYHVQGDWAGFAFVFASNGATITPDPAVGYTTMVDKDGPYCAKGTVAADYTSIAAVGFNTKQDKIKDAPTGKATTTSTGMVVNVSNPGKSATLRVQIEDGTDPSATDAAEHRWCSTLSTFDKDVVIPWASFNTECWSGGAGKAFDPKTPLAKVIVYLPAAGPTGATQNFDFCVNKIGPADVKNRGTGTIGSSCNNTVSWSASSASGYDNIASGDGKYHFQANGWNMNGASHSLSLLTSCGFKVTSQGCNQPDTKSKPCSFPSVYIGTASGGTNKTSYSPKQISAITSAPTCLGWSAASNAADEYNVSYDVWLADSSGAGDAGVFLMVWFHKPAKAQPGGQPVEAVSIGNQLWNVWWGDNGAGKNVVSYVAPSDLAQGQTYSFNLKDFLDDAVSRKDGSGKAYLTPSMYLIAVMGGTEIWGGGAGASITHFKAEVQ